MFEVCELRKCGAEDRDKFRGLLGLEVANVGRGVWGDMKVSLMERSL